MHRAITLVLVLVGLVSALGVTKQAEATVSSLWTDQVCAGDGTVSIHLTWGPLDAYATDQWLDLSWYDSSLGADLQQTSQGFSAGVNSISWSGLTPDIIYNAWVTQRFAPNLVSTSPTFSFRTAPCSSTQPGEIVSMQTTPASSDAGSSELAPPRVTTTKPPVTSSNPPETTEPTPTPTRPTATSRPSPTPRPSATPTGQQLPPGFPTATPQQLPPGFPTATP